MINNTTLIEKCIIDLSGSSEKRFPEYPVFFHRGYVMAIEILYEKCQSRNVSEFYDFIRKELIPGFRSHIKGNESVDDRYRGAIQACVDVIRYIMRNKFIDYCADNGYTVVEDANGIDIRDCVESLKK
jgi:hypothetical protein